jgi:hypothetical protein
MNSTITEESEILSRVIGSENPDFTPEVARAILRLRFDSSDRDRMNELAAKARSGLLTETESAQLEAYLSVGSILDLMQAKARKTLAAASNATDGR